MGGAGPHGPKVPAWLGVPELLHPDFSLFASRITASGFYHAPLTPASSVESYGNRGVPQHLETRVCLLPSWNLPPGPAPPQLFSPRHRLLSWRCRHSPRLTAARILCLPEGTQTPSPREGFMCPLVHLWSFLFHSPSLCLSSSHIPRHERFITGFPLAPCPQPSLPLFSVLFIANSACEFGWYFMVCNLLVLPRVPSLAF